MVRGKYYIHPGSREEAKELAHNLQKKLAEEIPGEWMFRLWEEPVGWLYQVSDGMFTITETFRIDERTNQTLPCYQVVVKQFHDSKFGLELWRDTVDKIPCPDDPVTAVRTAQFLVGKLAETLGGKS